MKWLILNKYSFALHGAGPIFLILSFFSLAVIGLYSKAYLEKETGRYRYWFLYSLFSGGILICSCAGNLETFFIGWEMVGLASFFLIAFYQANARSLENSLLALANYKICDIFFIMAIFLHESHSESLAGAFLILATLGKSAQLPFSSWLYRALEGPTPSSTVFYGGLSLHLGAFLLIQHSELWSSTPSLRLLVGVIGLASAFYGFLVGSTRSDLKTSFAFASISQVGLIYVEIALGWYGFALWHMVGHNTLRTWNYLRSASFFEDFFRKDHHHGRGVIYSFLWTWNRALYFHALNGFYLDRIFINLRKYSLMAFMVSTLFIALQSFWTGILPWEIILIIWALMLSIYSFIDPKQSFKNQFLSLTLSQVLALVAIHLFYMDVIEETYLLSSLAALFVLSYSLSPALKIWWNTQEASNKGFLGLAKQYPGRHILFLFAVITITASPGSLQFFFQESILDGLWARSHTFMVMALVCMTLNAYHFFRLGQHAFLGRTLPSVYSKYKPRVNLQPTAII